ncbi:unnamed protein product [Diamesa serratosioi]
MEKFDSLFLFKLPIRIVKLLGLWQDENSSWIYRLYGLLFHLVCIDLYVFMQIIYLVFMFEDVNDFSHVLGGVVIYFVIILKTSNFMYELKEIKMLIVMMEKLIDFTANGNKQRPLIQKQVLRDHKVFKIFLTNCVVSAWLAIIVIIVYHQEHRLPYKTWAPVDYHNNKNWYWVLAFYQIICPTCGACIVATLDMLPVFFICIATGLIKELCQRIGSIGEKDAKLIIEPPTKLQIKFLLLSQQRLTQEEHLKELLNCIEIHKEIKKFATKSGEIFSTMIFAQGVSSSINMCTAAFQLSLIKPYSEFSLLIHLIVYIFATILLIFIPCYIGNDLRLSSEKLSNKIFHSDWISESKNFKIAMKLFMENVKRPIIISAFNIFDLNLENFIRIFNFAYSLYALLKHINA